MSFLNYLKPEKMRGLFLLLLSLFLFSVVQGQQMPLYTQFYENPYMTNPGYAGHDSVTTASLLYRNQWAGITGAPTTQVLTVNGRLGKKDMGLAAMVYNDMSNIYGRTGGYMSYSYRIQFDTLHAVRAGISLGAVNNRIHFDKIQAENPGETTLLTNSQGGTKFDGGIGFLYTYGDKLEVGLSALQMFNSTFTYTDQANQKEATYSLLRHFYMTAKYNFQLVPNEWGVSPLVQLRSVQGTPIQWDLGVQGKWRNLVWMTVMYRSNYAVALAAGGQLNDNIKLGYAYEIATNGIGKQSHGTHELVFSYAFNKKKSKSLKSGKEVSSVDEERFTTLEQKVDSLENRLLKVEEDAAAHRLEFDSVIISKQEMRELIEQNAEDILRKNAEIERLKRQHLETSEERHQFVVQENVDLSKLDTFNVKKWDYYVVIGTYTEFNYAKFLQKVMKRDYNLTTHLTKGVSNKYYILWTKQVFTKEGTTQEIERINNIIDDKYVDEGAWLYHTRKTFE